MFKKATKSQARLRLALVGPSGSGKTYSALRIASGLSARVALIDTERASASKYADRFSFDTCQLESFHPDQYIKAIKDAEAAGYEVLVIDSLSHAWSGKDGALELVDQAAKRSKSNNSFAAWRDVTPLHHALVDAILRSSCHVIATMRSKTEYVLETVNGKQRPRKVGMAPVQRDGMEYEFDVVGDLDEATLVVTKSRCPELSRAVIKEPGEALAKQLKAWLSDAEPVAEEVKAPPPADPALDFSEVSSYELREQKAKLANGLAAHPKARNAAQVKARLDAVVAELARRATLDESATLGAPQEPVKAPPAESPKPYATPFEERDGAYHGD